MAEILIRGLDPIVVACLKRRAKADGRSLQAEVKGILESAAKLDPDAARTLARQVRHKLGPRRMADSTALVRRDRRR